MKFHHFISNILQIMNMQSYFCQLSLKRRGKDGQKSEKRTPQTPSVVRAQPQSLSVAQTVEHDANSGKIIGLILREFVN